MAVRRGSGDPLEAGGWRSDADLAIRLKLVKRNADLAIRSKLVKRNADLTIRLKLVDNDPLEASG